MARIGLLQTELMVMEIIKTKDEMQKRSEELRSEGKHIGFVPTMGFLHNGHLSLLHMAIEKTDIVAASIFVNPEQFGPGEDFEKYPRDSERDHKLLEDMKCDILFSPSANEMYPPGYQSYVHVERLSEVLCGRFRPGHFRGVTTIVLKLFHIVKPKIAFFGQKDAQQAIIIQKMVRDLDLDIEVLIAPTVRELDGLAISSRNVFLSSDERKDAVVIYESLQNAKTMILEGERDSERVKHTMMEMILGNGGKKIDYIEIVKMDSLHPVNSIQGEVLIVLAVWIGNTRLIDNLILKAQDRSSEE